MTLQVVNLTFLLFYLCIDLTLAVAETSTDSPSLDFPLWIVIMMAIVVGLLVLLLGYFVLRRYLSRRKTVNTIDQLEKQHTTNTESTVTVETLSKPPPSQVYKPAMIEQDKISLPLPPPSTSLFSDKMELNSADAMQLFEKYMQTERTKTGGFTTLDLDMPQLVNTVQQKVGTIKSNLRQSLRRQKSKSRAAPVHQMFDAISSDVPPPRPSVSEISRHTASPSPTPRSKTPTNTSSPICKQDKEPTATLNDDNRNNDIRALEQLQQLDIIDSMPSRSSTPSVLPASSLFVPAVAADSTSATSAAPASPASRAPSPSSSSFSPSPSPSPAPAPTSTNQEEKTYSDTSAIHAARRVIQSASRKSKTRSTLINEEAVLKMFNQDMFPTNASEAELSLHERGHHQEPQQQQSSRDRHRASIASGYTTVSGRSTNATSTRYLTNDILVRRASTLGKSYQASKAKGASARLEGLFDMPPVPANAKIASEKIEVTQVFDLAEKEGRKMDEPLPIGSSKFSVPDDLFLHPTQEIQVRSSSPAIDITDTSTSFTQQTGLPLAATSIGSKKRSTLFVNDGNSSSKPTIQDRTDNFEGLSSHTESTGHSRKSSASAATMVRISQQQSQTWSGRGPAKRASIPLQHQQQRQQQECSLPVSAAAHDNTQQDDYDKRKLTSISPSSDREKKLAPFYTTRMGRPRQRTGLPSWYGPDDTAFSPEDKTPAERERDQYLETLYGHDA